ncbi:MAG TPA: histidine phosphatase family protein [Micropepsaceae bacterium]|nr:histidine phosphatase family protein [Micropepsaceae bacterium]
MPRIHLVRHGKAAATFTEASDPGLDAQGKQQAEATAQRLALLAPVQLLSSPLKRARETALPLETRWQRSARIEDAIAEIPSPGIAMDARGAWLRAIMTGTWSDAPAPQRQWASNVVATLLALPHDVIAFSHFVAINVAVAHALGRDEVTVFRPDNASITILESDGKNLRVIELGSEAATSVG